MKSKQIGSMSVHRLVEFNSMGVPATGMFPTCTPEMLARGRTWLDERFIAADSDRIFLSMHSFVIQTGGVNILVDACHGNGKKRDGAQAYYNELQTDYLGGLGRLGLRPEDIHCVLCTHLHFDHVGWNTRLENGHWVPTFPNARYLMGKPDYDHFVTFPADAPDAMHLPSFTDSVLPVVAAGKAELLEMDRLSSYEIGPGLTLESAAGHTLGSVVLHAESGGRKALFTGDVWHHPLQIAEPSLGIFVDYDRQMADATKRRILERTADTDTLIMAAHFPAPTAGRIISHGDGHRFAFADD